MSYFLSNEALQEGQTVTLAGEEAAHILSARRMRPGETFELQDPAGRRFAVELCPAPPRKVLARVLRPAALPPSPPLRLTLLQAAVKDKANEAVLRQATELGVARMIVFPSAYAPGRPRERHRKRHYEAGGDKAHERWLRIAWEACKQCGRPAPPAIHLVDSLQAALAAASEAPAAGEDPLTVAVADPAPGATPDAGPGWVLHPAAALTPQAALAAHRGAPPTQARLAVGPEGGFSQHEVAALLAAGFTAVTLPGPILRADTAALTGCSLMLHGRWGA